ncbi:heparanase-like protein 3 isoform X2 [Eucalyptus grandis]|uniref:heparanase-like protein 3 isoform X2 n=1 Tax=Eucalyptus grandis TaxID=71139 RepID=UPI00192F01FB|nr:heparanase-like protein 3 isoform X2 [Eucalyptus grandis]
MYCRAASLLVLVGSGVLVLWVCYNSSLPVSQSAGILFINGTASVAKTDDDYICATLDWWPPEKCDYGTCSWGRATLQTLDLKNTLLLNAVKAFSPLRIRIGGTLQDKVVYETQGDDRPCGIFTKNSSEFLGFSQGCLPLARWDELNSFFKQTGSAVTFGLNALYGRIIGSDSFVNGPWNSSNAESLIQYTVNKGYSILGWELGNELSGHGVGARVSAHQYASDIKTLQHLVEEIYAGFEVKPLVLAPGGFFDVDWFAHFIDQTSKTLQVVTHHIYNLGPGVDDHLIYKILNPSYLDGAVRTFSSLQTLLKNSGTSAVAWVGEAGGAYNSGRNLVTNSFVFSFWYLDQLGMAATYDTKTYCRQTLIGGNYGLLNTQTFLPNPDYYSALLWHKLMGSEVLLTSFSGTDKIRAYAHCSKNSPGITLLLINLDGKTTVQVHVSTENVTSKGTVTLKHESQNHRTRFASMSRGSSNDGNIREEYHLNAKEGNIQSQVLLLNRKVLNIDSSGNIPSLDPIYVSHSDPITVAPFSVVFARIPSMNVPACI